MIERRTEQRSIHGRLRALAWLVAVPLAIGSTSACALETDEEEDETGEIADELSKAGGVEVVQCNPFYAGAYERPDRKSPRNWATAKRFARMLDRTRTHAAVIGMQEIETAEDAEQMRGILAAETGRRWRVRWFHKQKAADALPATGEAIYWRPAVFDLVEDFGTKQIDALDTRTEQEGLSVRFGGLLLKRKGTKRKLAVFTGKLAWYGSKSDGARIDNDDRARQVTVLQRWIDEKTSSHRRASRVILADMNSSYGSKPHQAMLRQYQDGGAREPTHFEFGRARLDYVFWDYDSGKKRVDGIFGRPTVSGDFGSDHRFVTAKIYVRAEDEQ